MSLSSVLAPHLPYIRRYARSITGTSQEGDLLVATMLEAIIAEPILLSDKDVSIKNAAYKLLSQLALTSAEHPKAGMLAKMAFALSSTENFSDEEGGEILECSKGVFSELKAQAAAAIVRNLNGAKALIIEDEPLIASDLGQIMQDLGGSVVGVARTRQEAVALFGDTLPDIVLADIQLADGSSGIDAVNDMLAVRKLPVIFITAYPERLLVGDRPEPAFLVTKPFDVKDLKTIIGQALTL